MRPSCFALLAGPLLALGCHAEAVTSGPAPGSTACTGRTTWMRAVTTSGPIRPGHVALDADCGAVITGATPGSLDADGKTVLSVGPAGAQLALAVSAEGAVVWAVPLGTATSGLDGLAVAALGSGDFVVAGTLEGDLDAPGGALHGGAGAPFLARLDGGSGAVGWAKLLPGADTTVAGVAVDAHDDVVVAGSFSGAIDLGAGALTSAGGRDVLVARFDADGRLLHGLRLGGEEDDEARAVAVDARGSIFVGGSTNGHTVDPCPTGSGAGACEETQALLLKLDAAGRVTWQQTPGAAGRLDAVTSLGVDGEDDVVTVAVVDAALGGGEAVTCNAPDGEPMWSLVDPTSSSVVRLDRSSNVYLTGGFAAAAPPDFGGGYLGVSKSQMGLTVPYVAKLDGERQHLYSEGFSVGQDTQGGDVAADAAGGVWLLMGYGAAFQTDLGAVPSPGPGGSGLLLSRFAPTTLMGEPRKIAEPGPGG